MNRQALRQAKIERVAAYRFPPGKSGNPLGPGYNVLQMARIIRETSGYGAELAGFFFRIMRGEAIPLKNRRMPHVPTLDQRINAAAWLADRGWGKAKETIELTGEASPQERVEILRRLSEDERAQLRALLSRALESNDTSISIESNTAEPQNAPSAGASELEAIPPVESGS